MVQSYVGFDMIFGQAMKDPLELKVELMPFRCTGCQTQPGWYRRGRLIVMRCSCGSVASDYPQLPFFPQTDREWSQWLLIHNPISKDLMLRG
jgi:hypothetical protein